MYVYTYIQSSVKENSGVNFENSYLRAARPITWGLRYCHFTTVTTFMYTRTHTIQCLIFTLPAPSLRGFGIDTHNHVHTYIHTHTQNTMTCTNMQ